MNLFRCIGVLFLQGHAGPAMEGDKDSRCCVLPQAARQPSWTDELLGCDIHAVLGLSFQASPSARAQLIWEGLVDRQSSASRSASDLGGTLSRRKIFKGAVGVAAVGAAGGSLLAEVVAAPTAKAATMGTTVESGAVAPAVVNLSDAATIAVDASLGNDFRVTINGNRTLGNPANPADGQKMVVQVTQGTGGNFTLSYGTAYETGPACRAHPQHHGREYRPARVRLQRGEGQMAARRIRDRVRLDHHSPAGRHLPAVRVYQRPDGPGLLLRLVPGRHRIRGHQRRNLVRRLLVVGVPVRAVNVAAEVRALVRLQQRGREGDPRHRGHLGCADRRDSGTMCRCPPQYRWPPAPITTRPPASPAASRTPTASSAPVTPTALASPPTTDR